MENAVRVKNIVTACAATVGSAAINLLGGWDAALQVLVAAMGVDYITGVLVAGVFHCSAKTKTGALESQAGFKGLARKCTVLLMVFFAVLLDRATGYGFVRTAVCLFFTANEGLSILENVGLMGVPYPEFLRNMLEALRKQGDSAKKED